MPNRSLTILLAVLVGLAAPARAAEPVVAPADQRARDAGFTRIDLVDALPYGGNYAFVAAGQLLNDVAFQVRTNLVLEPRAGTQRHRPDAQNSAMEARTKSDLLAGKIDAALLPLAAFQRQSALFAADQIPFLVVDEASSARLIQALAPLLDARLAEHGLGLLALVPLLPVGLTGVPEGLGGGLPKSLLVSDAAGRRLGELIGADIIEVPPHDMLERIAADPSRSAYATAPGVPRDHFANPTLHPPRPGEHQLLTMSAWPLAMIVVRRKLIGDWTEAARTDIWRLAAEQNSYVYKMCRDAVVRAAWPAARAGLMSPKAAERTMRSADGEAARPELPPRAADVLARLRAAGLAMAREWATDAGADGFALLKSLGVELDDEKR